MVALRESLKIYRKWGTYNIKDNLTNEENIAEQIEEEVEHNGDTDDGFDNDNTDEDLNIEDEDLNIEDEDSIIEDEDTNEENLEDEQVHDTHRTHLTLEYGVGFESLESNDESQ
ncbi:hypothetical protein GPJ56_008069 [Histomonas meleagridis]|uniref:uncharacterized protein n=1 Tax=Histomonas meleagridis TaxID=135588 RepID=UPI00355A0A37|nr:hypothetical protein GPJ56_008069 [Histomonas meleagridis]KAH0800300.1 hypothetical protein GO595_006889 [Histomonas meleagridis]